jgi:hypothetical protein
MPRTVLRPAGFKQKPGATFAFVDPHFNQAGRCNVAVFVPQAVHFTQAAWGSAEVASAAGLGAVFGVGLIMVFSVMCGRFEGVLFSAKARLGPSDLGWRAQSFGLN